MLAHLRAWLETRRRPVTLGAWLLVAGALVGCWAPGWGFNAVAVEALATGFWLWARRAENGEVQVRRWGWLRRPATAMWLAFALSVVSAPALALAPGAAAGVRAAAAAAALWAALELLGALPFARPYPDWPAPVSGLGPWLPLVVAACGMGLLVRGAPLWLRFPLLAALAAALLLYCAGVAMLRAFGRPHWASSLRWLAVTDSALAGVLVALGRVPLEAGLLLWLAVFGTRAVLLWTEVRGATARRSAPLRAAWRLLGWATGAALGWAVVLSLALRGGALGVLGLAVTLAASGSAAGLAVARIQPATERRALPRRKEALPIAVTAGLALLWGAFAGAGRAWAGGLWAAGGLVAGLVVALLALAGGAGHLATHLRREEPAERMARLGRAARNAARSSYEALVRFEHGAFGLLPRSAQGLLAPLRDLHTGDAQEYLMLLMALVAVALLLTFLG